MLLCGSLIPYILLCIHYCRFSHCCLLILNLFSSRFIPFLLSTHCGISYTVATPQWFRWSAQGIYQRNDVCSLGFVRRKRSTTRVAGLSAKVAKSTCLFSGYGRLLLATRTNKTSPQTSSKNGLKESVSFRQQPFWDREVPYIQKYPRKCSCLSPFWPHTALKNLVSGFRSNSSRYRKKQPQLPTKPTFRRWLHERISAAGSISV